MASENGDLLQMDAMHSVPTVKGHVFSGGTESRP